jgi:hypothetical protein
VRGPDLAPNLENLPRAIIAHLPLALPTYPVAALVLRHIVVVTVVVTAVTRRRFEGTAAWGTLHEWLFISNCQLSLEPFIPDPFSSRNYNLRRESPI